MQAEIWYLMRQDFQGVGLSWGVVTSVVLLDSVNLGSPHSPKPGNLRVHGLPLPLCVLLGREGTSVSPSIKWAHSLHQSLNMWTQCENVCEMPV